MFQAVSPPIMSSKTVHTASGICQACLLLPLAVAASKQIKKCGVGMAYSGEKCHTKFRKVHQMTQKKKRG